MLQAKSHCSFENIHMCVLELEINWVIAQLLIENQLATILIIKSFLIKWSIIIKTFLKLENFLFL